ncbi:hypothetical protein [Chitinophaga ginsengisoli]|uniref:Lipoprotein n=1 Tax=Chitinophaga ginsengisoli TaxID=363837 RepID=A0A2P8FDV4_9BACT|nr:hypothetical protein [Chitinophaga ginsengisoli]PSL19897.1 hypothetical protein CLV42_1269 [Chitinophaga ginsengisoli]
MKTIHLLALVFNMMVHIALIGCNTKQIKKSIYHSVESSNHQFATALSDARFKQWLSDTIPFLTTASATTSQKNLGFLKRAINISPDSLAVSVTDAYGFSLSEKKSTDTSSRAAIVLNMLGVVEEVPRKESTIQFEHYTFYSPSSLQRFTYESAEEYKNIKVFVAGSSDTTTYQCLRGLIVSKTDIKKGKDNKLKKTDYDISWDGKTVEKRQTNTVQYYHPLHYFACS